MAFGALDYDAYKQRVAEIESGSGRRSPNIYQFMPGTKEHYGWSADRASQEAAMYRLSKDNYDQLSYALGRPPTADELYFAHQQGPTGAFQLMSNPGRRAGDIVGDAAIRNNGGDPNAPAGAFRALWRAKYNKQPDQSDGYSPAFQEALKGGDPLMGGPSSSGPVYNPAFMKAIEGGDDPLGMNRETPKPKVAPTKPLEAAAPLQEAGPETAGDIVDNKMPPPSAVHAAATGFINGIPIAGPYALGGLQRLAAWRRSQNTMEPYGQALSEVQNRDTETLNAYPKTALAGGIGGAAAGSLPLMAAAPWALGAGELPVVVGAPIAGVTGGALAGADRISRNYAEGQPLSHDVVPAMEWGAAGGAAGPIVGAALSGATGGATNLAARTSSGARNVANLMNDIGMTVPAARQQLARMGPEAVIADLDPALADEAGSVAAIGANPGSVLKRAMLSRSAGKDARVNDIVVSALGPRPDIEAAKGSIIADARAAASPYYMNASSSPLNIQPVLSYIDAQLDNATGPVEKALKTAKGYLTKQGPMGMLVPKDDPRSLLSARQALDDFIQRGGDQETTAGRNALAQAKAVRRQLDQIVKTDPNVATGDAIYSAKMNALEKGAEVFKKSTNLESFQRDVASMTPEQLDAARTGALSALHDELGGPQGDYARARQMFAKSSINRAKLDALFPDAGKVFDKIEAEMAMRATEQKVASGSDTAARLARQAKYSLAAHPGGDVSVVAPLVGEAVGGGYGASALTGASYLYNRIRQEIARNSLSSLASGTARGLVARGPEQAAFLDQVARARASNRIMSALSGGARTAGNLGVRSSALPLEQMIWAGQAGQQ